MRLYIETFNCGNNNTQIQIPDGYDIYVIGFQECVDSLSKISLASSLKIISIIEMGQIKMIVYGKKSIVKNITHVKESICPTGILSVGVNKGAVICSMKIYKKSYCFIVSHLAAHIKNVAARNTDYLQILKSIKNFYLFDYVFWCGDLNYRINSDYNTVIDMISRKNWNYLLKRDQLKHEQLKKCIFLDFKEGEIKFAPTYKIKDDEYDTLRIPSWCDRILYKTAEKIKQPIYNSNFESGNISDHRPVYSVFTIPIKSEKIYKVKIFNISVDLHKSFDINGLCDPYVRFISNSKSKKTNIKYKTLNAVWKSSIKMNTTSVIKIIVKDYDMLSRNDIVGFATTNITIGDHSIDLVKNEKVVGIISFTLS